MRPDERREVQAWCARLADGDREAFAPLYAVVAPLFRRFAARALGPVEAEDAAQSALLKIFARASELDPERDAVAWMIGVIAYECRTFRKRAARRREGGEPSDEALVTRRTAEDDLIDLDLEQAAREALGELRPRDAETLRAVLAGERPADAAGATFRKRVERALARLRVVWRSKHGID